RGRFQIEAFDQQHPADVLRRLARFEIKELELTAFAGEPAYLARLAGGDTRVVPLNGEPLFGFDWERIAAVVTTAAKPSGGASVRLLTQYDVYYLDRHRKRPLPVVFAQLYGADRTRFYIDPKTACVVGSYDSRNWVSRWL